MFDDAQHDPLFDAVRELIIKTRRPSVALMQRVFSLGYKRAAALVAALEGDIVTAPDEQGMRSMLHCEKINTEGLRLAASEQINSVMGSFNSSFFDHLAKLKEFDSFTFSPRDGVRWHLSELQEKGVVGESFVQLTCRFVDLLSARSGGRYEFEKDFCVRPRQIYSYSKGRAGRQQLYVRFDALAPHHLPFSNMGVSIGLGFDFRNEHGVIAACVNEYEEFIRKVYMNPGLFNSTFGSLGGYAEPHEQFSTPVSAKTAWKTTPTILQDWIFFGLRLNPSEILGIGNLENFVDECIRVFDLICEAEHYASQIKKHHIVLLGDSIFDNAIYVPDGFSVSRHLLQSVPAWKTTLLAVDGSVTTEVVDQLTQVPDDATYLVISTGGNDALNSIGIFYIPVNTVGEALSHLGRVRDNFQLNYHAMLKQVMAANLPVAVCTIYNSVPGLGDEEKTALALFNEIILQEAGMFKLPVIDLRLICNEETDYSPVSPIEPSHLGGMKIAQAVISIVKNSTELI